MNILNYEEFKNLPEAASFVNENQDVGTLKIEAFTAYKAVPIPNVEILITKDFGNNKVVFFRGYTNSSGIIENIKLPAPSGKYDPVNYTEPDYTLYDLTAISEGYEIIKKYNIGMFGGVNVIQYVKMIPAVNLEGVDLDGN